MISHLLKFLSETETVALIALGGVLASAVLSAVVASSVARRSVFINSVTAERSKWIDALRKNISSLIGNYRQFITESPDAKYATSDVYKKQSKEVGELTCLIKLQLNPRNEIDQQIISILNKIQMEFRDLNFDYHRAERLLIEHSQWLLKEEWERVKYEASGWFPKYFIAGRRDARLRNYRAFADGAGALGDLRVPKPPLTAK